MTTIIAVEHEAGVTLGWDSTTAYGNSIFESEHPKVFANGEVIFGSAGDVRRTNALAHMEVPATDEVGWDVDRYVHDALLPAMLDAFDERTVNGNYPEGETLVVVRGRVYEIGNDGCITRRKDRQYAIGSGAAYAYGALRSRVGVREAVDVAKYFDGGTGHTIHIKQSTELLHEGNPA